MFNLLFFFLHYPFCICLCKTFIFLLESFFTRTLGLSSVIPRFNYIFQCFKPQFVGNKAKGQISNGRYKKTKHVKFFEKRKSGTCAYQGKKCSFFRTFRVLCFLLIPVLRFALLPYCGQISDHGCFCKKKKPNSIIELKYQSFCLFVCNRNNFNVTISSLLIIENVTPLIK